MNRSTRILNTDGGILPVGRLLTTGRQGDDTFWVRRRVNIENRQLGSSEDDTQGPFEVTPIENGVRVTGGFVLYTSVGRPTERVYREVPTAELNAGPGNSIYVTVTTDKWGKPQTAAFQIGSGAMTSTHYVPDVDGKAPSGAGSQNGTYYYEIARLSEEDGNIVVTGVHQGGTIEIQNVLWAGKNLGDENSGRVFKGFKPSSKEFEFRSIVGGYATEVESTDNAVKLKFKGTNVGGGNNIYIDGAGDDEDAKFRGIQGEGEVQVSLDGETITVRGNEKSGYLRFTNCQGEIMAQLNWSDGLITDNSNLDVVAGCPETPSEGE